MSMDTGPQARAPEDLPIILVADDVPENLATITAMIRHEALEVRVAKNGPTALRYAELQPHPDVILLDIMMPGMDGYEVLRHLKQNPATAHIPVIFVTAMGDPADEARGLAEGAADYVTKPINAAILRARVRTQFEVKRARDRDRIEKTWLELEVQRRIQQSEALEVRLGMALEASGFGAWECDRITGQVTWDDRLARLFGLTQRPDTLHAWLDLAHPDDRATLEHWLKSAIELPPREIRLRDGAGHWRDVEIRGGLVPVTADAPPHQLCGVMADITERRQKEAEQRLAAAVFAGISDGVCITDARTEILMVNEAFSRITGHDRAALVGQTPRVLKSGAHTPSFYKAMWEALNREDQWQGEITNRRKDGELVSEWLSISVVRNAQGQITNYIGIFSDLSERKAAANRIQYLATYDPLTDLPNRNLLTDRLNQALINARRFNRQAAVILLDIDRFRSLNDTLGPPVGDLVLIEVARRLSLQVREGDTVGRRSGNEFGFVMASLAHEHDVIALAQRMLTAISQPFDLPDRQVILTASIGISVAPRDGDSAEELFRAADMALSRAKDAGRNTFRFYSPDMDAHAARRLSLENALHHALERGELNMVYQPQVSLESGNLIGMEALMRWKHPEFGQVSPMEFIPIAEETGLILPLGTWALRTACLQTRRWLDLGLASLRVAVNLSTRQFRQPDLPRLVAETLAETGLPPAALELEITESAFIDDVENAVAQSVALKSLGIKLSLDDFGTGYSSLAYLSRFPFDKIKIDQGFVRDITENPVNAAIASAAIVMARSLNLTVLAEGVETEAQARFLRGRRCDSIQGYLFSRPLEVQDFEQLLAGPPRLPINDEGEDSRQTLLLVDDEPNVLNALTRLLRREGYRILAATNAAEAFELLAKNHVQVIVSDQRMPEMSGTEFFTRVRQLHPETMRIILTGYTDLESVTAAINHGAIYKFLTKPWDDDQLREQIREAFRLSHDVHSGPGAHHDA